MRVAEVRIDGGKSDTLLLHSLSGRDELGRPSEYELELVSKDAELDLSKMVGQTFTVSLELPNDKGKRHINGYVASFYFTGIEAGFARYRCTLRPWIWILGYRKNCRIFQNKTIPDIIKQIFQEHGFSNVADFGGLTNSRYKERVYLVQYGESDLDFVTRLMEQEGIYYYFEHKEKTHKLILCDSPGAHETISGYEKIPYYPPNADQRRERDHVESWRIGQSIRSGAAAQRSFDFTKPKADLEVEASISKKQYDLASPSASAQKDLEVYEYSGLYEEVPAGEGYARTQLERGVTNFEVAHASGDLRGIHSGILFSLTDFPRKDQNREYLVIAASYELVINEYESSSRAAGVDFVCHFQAIPGATPFRLPRTTTKPLIEGPQTAIVVGPSGKEIWTDEYGRVKLQFHWDREGKKDENSSCWVRVSQLWAGSKWGGIHIPRIGQEVIVEFMDGDPDRPIITGRVYNADNMPPYALSKNQTQSGIKSRSTEKGGANNFNELRFEDKKGDEHIYLQAEKDFNILVKNDEDRKVENDRRKEVVANETVKIGKNRTEEVVENETITVKGNRTETVEKDETITIKGNRKETVEKDETITIKGNRTETVEKNETITVKGDRTETVDGKEAVTVKGDQTLDLGSKVTISIKSDRSTEIGGSDTLTVKGDSEQSVDGDGTVTIKGDHKRSTTGKDTVSAKGDLTLETKGSGKVDATQKLQLKAGTELKLECGAASITLKSSGAVEIKGTQIKIEGAAKVEAKAAQVKVQGMISLG